MSDVANAYMKLTENFTQWAQTEDNIRAAIIIGSRARFDHPADDWSDLDIVIFAQEPEIYLNNSKWLSTFGSPWLSFVEPTRDQKYMELRALFADGLDVDFVPQPVSLLEDMFKNGFSRDFVEIINRGIRFLVDKDGFSSQLQKSRIPLLKYKTPTQEEFHNLINNFWYYAVWTAKRLRREELWRAISACDNTMKKLLWTMMEWHALIPREDEGSHSFQGQFVERWADPRALKVLPEIFAHYDLEDIWKALFSTMELFNWMEHETARYLEYSLPDNGEKHTIDYISKLFEGRKQKE
ncbi:MAG: aminoglycoside 6-adenylyltransferase [Anaerolineaceae bacterium]|nr:aminoglycoside 6-adenylyltransferase [Anaerolineaceae bacterium]